MKDYFLVLIKLFLKGSGNILGLAGLPSLSKLLSSVVIVWKQQWTICGYVAIKLYKNSGLPTGHSWQPFSLPTIRELDHFRNVKFLRDAEMMKQSHGIDRGTHWCGNQALPCCIKYYVSVNTYNLVFCFWLNIPDIL